MAKSLFSEAFFKRFGLLTVWSVFFLMFIGGLVRVTGSGMGCPDWPKCFGQWVPPTNVSELPADYRERFAEPGKPVAEFNAAHTITEYINRLVGVLTGLFIGITMVSSFQYRKSEPSIFWLSIAAFIMVAFQGWIGAKVVSSNLAGWMITVHMLLALAVVALVMMAVFRKESISGLKKAEDLKSYRNLNLISLGISLIQITVGTQVREKIDELLAAGHHNSWADNMEQLLNSHIFLSFFIVALNIILFFRAKNLFQTGSGLHKAALWALVFTLAQVVTGAFNVWFNLPGVAQTIHIVAGALICGAQFYTAIVMYNSRKIKIIKNPVNIRVANAG